MEEKHESNWPRLEIASFVMGIIPIVLLFLVSQFTNWKLPNNMFSVTMTGLFLYAVVGVILGVIGYFKGESESMAGWGILLNSLPILLVLSLLIMHP